jgi:hypothetical protein
MPGTSLKNAGKGFESNDSNAAISKPSSLPNRSKESREPSQSPEGAVFANEDSGRVTDSKEIDKYIDKQSTISPKKEVFVADEILSPDAQAVKDLALLRQTNMRIKVEKARSIVEALKASKPVDGRTLYPSCEERIFRYNYDNGNIKTSFVSVWGMYPRPVSQSFMYCC